MATKKIPFPLPRYYLRRVKPQILHNIMQTKPSYALLGILIFLLCSSFGPNLECAYAGSNINFAKNETQNALESADVNKARYHAYKALNAIEKSKDKLTECGCRYANERLEESITDLKNAIKAVSLGAAHVLLKRSMEHSAETLESLEEHHLHDSDYDDKLLAMNIKKAEVGNRLTGKDASVALNDKIDRSLQKYSESLTNIVNTVDCKEAREFAQNIYDRCEAQLLRKDLSDGKKYYNLRTLEITKEALEAIGDCKKTTF